MYSTVPSTGQLTPTLVVSLTSGLSSLPEFIALQKIYALFKINSLDLVISNAQKPASVFDSFPALYLDVIPNYSIIDANSAANSDTALQYQVNNNFKNVRAHHPFPSLMVNQAGYPMAGSQLWISTPAYAGASGLYLVLGYKNGPVSVSTTSEKICEINIKLNCTFAKPITLV
jgi:hypothetical protein